MNKVYLVMMIELYPHMQLCIQDSGVRIPGTVVASFFYHNYSHFSTESNHFREFGLIYISAKIMLPFTPNINKRCVDK